MVSIFSLIYGINPPLSNQSVLIPPTYFYI